AADAAVDVEEEAALERELADLLDRVDDAVGVARGRGGEEDRVRRDCVADRGDGGAEADRVDGARDGLEGEGTGGLVQGGRGGDGADDLGCCRTGRAAPSSRRGRAGAPGPCARSA